MPGPKKNLRIRRNFEGTSELARLSLEDKADLMEIIQMYVDPLEYERTRLITYQYLVALTSITLASSTYLFWSRIILTDGIVCI